MVNMVANPSLVACHECDLLQREVDLPPGGKAVCSRCGATLYVRRRDTIDRTLALILAAAVLFVIGNSFPVVTMEIQGQRTEALVWQGAWRLYRDGEPLVGGIVFLTAFAFPLVQIAGMLAILVPVRLGLTPRYLVPAFRTVEESKPWSMVEVFMLGVLVSLVKLAHMATVVPGVGMWAFFALIVVLAGASSALDPRDVWERLELRTANGAAPVGRAEGRAA
jgi:paraquat-inducible protein A